MWLPVAMIAGAALWLTAPSEPPRGLAPALLTAGLAGAIAAAWWPSSEIAGWGVALRRVCAAVCALAAAGGLGALAAQIRTGAVAEAPVQVSEEPVAIEGWVAAIESSDRGPRLRLLVRSIDGAASPTRYVRVAVPPAGVLTPGRAATCRAVLQRPSGPMAPGAYDFARRAYFERLSATGFAYGRCRPAAFALPTGELDRARLQLAAMRSDLSAAVRAAAPGRGGGIAAALISGDRSAVDRDTNEVLFNAGLGHLLSVSGIHMSVIGGLVFALLIWGLSLISPIALRFPVKKLAAIGALTAVAAYLIVSGINVPALRAFVMAAVAFGAILLDRPAISMRGLALAAFIVVLMFPESVLEPGFQMSFAATMALVALFEMLKRAPHVPALPAPGPIIGAMQWSARGVGVVILIALVAGLATDPFAIYHFQRFALYSLPANLVSEPILSFLVAPAAIAAAVLAPFGLAEPALQLMASALDLIAAIGEAFGSRPEAVRALPQPPHAAFLLCVTAVLWACLWRGPLRWGGAVFFAAGVALYVTAPRPAAAFDTDLRVVYLRDAAAPTGWSLIASGGRSPYARERVGAMLGIAPAITERLTQPEACGAYACRWRTPRGREGVFVRSAEGWTDACVRGGIVISALAPPDDFAQRCAPALVLGPRERDAQGGAFLYDDEDGVRAVWGLPRGITRAWTVRAASEDQE